MCPCLGGLFVTAAPDPAFLATAVEAVVKAGELQMARFGSQVRVDKKGAIDLVTEIDLRVEREFRALIASRFPTHVVLGEEFSGVEDRDHVPEYCWVFDPVDGTTNYAHGLPIFCSSLALELDGRPIVGAVYDPTRRELFTAEQIAAHVDTRFRIRWLPAITPQNRIVFEGRAYDVQAVLELGRRDGLELLARARAE